MRARGFCLRQARLPEGVDQRTGGDWQLGDVASRQGCSRAAAQRGGAGDCGWDKGHRRAGGQLGRLRSAGFETCFVADFQVGVTSAVGDCPQVWKPAIQQAWKPALLAETAALPDARLTSRGLASRETACQRDRNRVTE